MSMRDIEAPTAMIDIATQVLDIARTKAAEIPGAHKADVEVLAGTTLSMAIQAVIMADFAQLKRATHLKGHHVEVPPEVLKSRCFAMGQAVGIILAGLSPDATHFLVASDAVMSGLVSGFSNRHGMQTRG